MASDVKTHLIIVAAGIGSRFKSTPTAKPKQYESIGTQTILAHSIQAYDEINIDGITVVLHPNDMHWQAIQPIASKHSIQTAIGGAERYDSVRNGIKALNAAKDDWVLVHDAARPCVTPDEINALIETCRQQQQGGLLVRPITDTIKYSKNGQQVKKTINREELFAALTPQMFRCGDLLKALTVFEADTVTDESSAIEAQNQKPLMVKGKASNIKITTYDDLALAEFILQRQGRV